MNIAFGEKSDGLPNWPMPFHYHHSQGHRPRITCRRNMAYGHRHWDLLPEVCLRLVLNVDL
ncbi:MAG: hypothetical protein ACKOAH_25180, partial [Pirellula sp.]